MQSPLDVASVAQVIDLIELHGGDVVKFAGDSMICAFVPTSSEKQASKDEGKRLATLRCVRCATQLSTKYGELTSCVVQVEVKNLKRNRGDRCSRVPYVAGASARGLVLSC